MPGSGAPNSLGSCGTGDALSGAGSSGTPISVPLFCCTPVSDDDGDVLVTVWVVHQVLQPGRQGEHLCSEAGAVLASWVLQLLFLLLLFLPVRPDTRTPDTSLVVPPSMEPSVQSHTAHCGRG